MARPQRRFPHGPAEQCGHKGPETWWTQPVKEPIANAADPELYRYGIHAPQLAVILTVAPGAYTVRVKLAERRPAADPARQPMDLFINGKPVAEGLDVASRAGGEKRALDLTFEKIEPLHGVIEVRFRAAGRGEAVVQAIELLPERPM